MIKVTLGCASESYLFLHHQKTEYQDDRTCSCYKAKFFKYDSVTRNFQGKAELENSTEL